MMETGDRERAEPLSERLPHYLVSFGIALVLAAAIGAVISLFTDASASTGAGYGLIGLGVLMMLAGGASGGGYANMGVGAVGALFGGQRRHDDDVDDPDVRMGGSGKRDPMERLRKGLRPEANPSAFWQVIGGIAAVAGGVLLLGAVG
jgi:hypothetical protein